MLVRVSGGEGSHMPHYMQRQCVQWEKCQKERDEAAA